MTQQLVFLDTEYSSLEPDAELLSLALVLDEESYLYLERQDFDNRICSSFVIETVLPLFGRFPQSFCLLHDFDARIRDWANTLSTHTIVTFDHSADWTYLGRVLGSRFPHQLHSEGLSLANFSLAPDFDEARLRWHEAHGRECHHALNDAMSLRHAYRSVNKHALAECGHA